MEICIHSAQAHPVMKSDYVCRVLVLDDKDVESALKNEMPTGIELKCVKTIEEALALFTPSLIPKTTLHSEAQNAQHSFDVVFLDWDLGEAQMNNYPHGGLSLQGLFQTCYSKQWPCFVIGYSDYLQAQKRELHWLLNFMEARARRSERLHHLFTSGVAKIQWKAILAERGKTILMHAPPNVVQEIIAAVEDNRENVNHLAQLQLNDLAVYLKAPTITLAQLLHVENPGEQEIWSLLDSVLVSRSLCGVLHDLYVTPVIYDLAHATGRKVTLVGQGVTLDLVNNVVVVPPAFATSLGTTTISRYCVPKTVVEGLNNIDTAHASDTEPKQFKKRCDDVHELFRLALCNKNTGGYLLKEWTTQANEDLYLYIPKDLLGNLLEDLSNQTKGSTEKIGPVVSSCGRWVTFFIKQTSTQIEFTGATAIAHSLATKPKWGPFPEIMRWGVICVTDKNKSCKCVWPNGTTDISSTDLNSPPNSLGLRFPVHG